ncbi:NADAR family protein [Streptomyces sp. NBC_00237]|uniref:NADAR family protein n=1 Tax=Streptomyces sp. NBC_00237 TaxID=2975687 RepID=UPI00224FF239|nr:NADAR family protein [Streptomyces sp. NBC_00237]MCX5206562.1 NADAR family protein [Streptomyces sp. NBC_00237]
MALRNPTYRDADGERVPGTWRHAFHRGGGICHLTGLVVYADGLIDWRGDGLVTVEEFAELVRSGRVVTELAEGERASAFRVGSWTMTGVRSYTEPECLIGEVRDEIEELNGRPTSTARCLVAVEVFLAERTDANRAALRAAYLEIPESLRVYALGDTDARDLPLQVLAAGPGGTAERLDEPVDEEDHEEAVRYFAEHAHWRDAAERHRDADGPQRPRTPPVRVEPAFGRAEKRPVARLRNEHPAPIRVDGVTYPTVTHAYWALSTDDAERAELIRTAQNPVGARELGEEAPRRAGWQDVRLAVMTRLVRAKFAQHVDLADELVGTGDAPLHHVGLPPRDYWDQSGAAGRNWMGRLLELVRSELRAERAGL